MQPIKAHNTPSNSKSSLRNFIHLFYFPESVTINSTFCLQLGNFIGNWYLFQFILHEIQSSDW